MRHLKQRPSVFDKQSLQEIHSSCMHNLDTLTLEEFNALLFTATHGDNKLDFVPLVPKLEALETQIADSAGLDTLLECYKN